MAQFFFTYGGGTVGKKNKSNLWTERGGNVREKNKPIFHRKQDKTQKIPP